MKISPPSTKQTKLVRIMNFNQPHTISIPLDTWFQVLLHFFHSQDVEDLFPIEAHHFFFGNFHGRTLTRGLRASRRRSHWVFFFFLFLSFRNSDRAHSTRRARRDEVWRRAQRNCYPFAFFRASTRSSTLLYPSFAYSCPLLLPSPAPPPAPPAPPAHLPHRLLLLFLPLLLFHSFAIHFASDSGTSLCRMTISAPTVPFLVHLPRLHDSPSSFLRRLPCLRGRLRKRTATPQLTTRLAFSRVQFDLTRIYLDFPVLTWDKIPRKNEWVLLSVLKWFFF